jgi:hypothetical protein
MTRGFFEQVSDAVNGFLPPRLRRFSFAVGSRNLKVWYGDDPHEHYEAQTLSSGRSVRLEIGFHAEHPDVQRNEQALARLLARERTWRRTLGALPEAGPFLGRQPAWRRLSEVWEGPGLETEEAAIEAAERLARYIRAFEARKGSPTSHDHAEGRIRSRPRRT